MIACILGHFAAEHVVAPKGINQNQRDDHQGADEHKAQAAVGGSCLPKADVGWNNVWPDADP